MTSDDDFMPVEGFDPTTVVAYDDRADYADMSEAVPDVLSGLYTSERTGDIADLLEEELDAVAQGFRDRKDREAERFELATNSDYWTCLCFATEAQRDAFVLGMNWRDLGARYIDGRAVAKRQNVEIPPDPEWPNSRRDTSWDQYAMTVEENRSIEP